MTKNSTFADGDWQHVFPKVPGESGPVKKLRLQNVDGLVALGNLARGNGTQNAVYNYKNQPEHACYAVCQNTLGKDCTFFTYDGLDDDSCAPSNRTVYCFGSVTHG
jgi:hypothetical protein